MRARPWPRAGNGGGSSPSRRPRPTACLTLLSRLPESPSRAPRPLTSSGDHICCSTTELGTQPGKRMGHRQYCGQGTAGPAESLNSTYPRDHPSWQRLHVWELSQAHSPVHDPSQEDRTSQSQAEGQAEYCPLWWLRWEVWVKLAFGSPDTHKFCTGSVQGDRRDFPLTARGQGSIPGQGTKILQAAHSRQEEKKGGGSRSPRGHTGGLGRWSSS